MKLYECPRNSIVRLLEEPNHPPASIRSKTNNLLKFHHVDGIYSYCIDENGNVVHPAAWTEVELVSPMETEEEKRMSVIGQNGNVGYDDNPS